MTSWEVPLPPDDLATVWDKDARPWMRAHPEPRDRGGVWMEVSKGTAADRLKWVDLVVELGPVTDYEPRCEATAYFGDFEQVEQKFRCLLAPNHAGHHKLPEDCWTEPER